MIIVTGGILMDRANAGLASEVFPGVKRNRPPADNEPKHVWRHHNKD